MAKNYFMINQKKESKYNSAMLYIVKTQQINFINASKKSILRMNRNIKKD